MKRRIAVDLLRRNILDVKPNPFTEMLHLAASSLVQDLLSDIKRPFKSVCIHGRYPSLVLPYIYEHSKKWNHNWSQCAVTVVDFVRNKEAEELLEHPLHPIREMRYIQSLEFWPIEHQNQYDAIISCLQLHHSNNIEHLFQKYLKTMKPDGVLIGSSFGKETISELYWSYLMAENQRSGGVSPKTLNFPELGELGTLMTSNNFKLITILQEDKELWLESPLDLIELLKITGQSNYLKGRRKGVYKDVLLAAMGIYSSEFREDEDGKTGVRATINFHKFIGWKQHQSQPKGGKKGPNVDSIQFLDEIKKFDPDAKSYDIGQEDDKK